MSWPLDKQIQTESRAESSSSATGRWVVGLLIVLFVIGFIASYAVMGTIFYRGQWQFLLNPSYSITAVPQVPFQKVRFGNAQLNGWWIPAAPGARWGHDTVLYLHGGVGSLSNAVGDLDALHALGVNVFAFDYRGYGKPTELHPSEASMMADTNAAWTYLTGARGLSANSIVIYGQGVGASLAANLAAERAPAGVVLDGPNKSEQQVVDDSARNNILPMRMFMVDQFDPTNVLRRLTVPKLFLDRNGAVPRTEALYHAAALPKQYFELKQDTGYSTTVSRFLGDVLQ